MGSESVKIWGGPRYNNHVAACFRLVSPLEIQQEQQQQDEKGCLMVMADPSDHGHGKKVIYIYSRIILITPLQVNDIIFAMAMIRSIGHDHQAPFLPWP